MSVEKPPPTNQPWYTSQILITGLSVATFAGSGTLIRIGLGLAFGTTGLKVTSLDSPITTSFITNIFGSFILGFLKSFLKDTLYTNVSKGLGTGLCGSITTFSAFNHEVNRLLIRKPPLVVFWLLSPLITLSTCIICFLFGNMLGRTCATKTDKDNLETHEWNPQTLFLVWLISFFVGLGLPAGLSLLIRPFEFVAILFAPIGALSRWYLGVKFNSQNESQIKWGTLAANLLGSLVLSIGLTGGSEILLASPHGFWIYAMTTGFCGCLTTVSTFIGEVVSIHETAPFKSFRYAVVTLVLGQILSSVPNAVHVF